VRLVVDGFEIVRVPTLVKAVDLGFGQAELGCAQVVRELFLGPGTDDQRGHQHEPGDREP
jgi:hypothetical protein